MHCHFISVVWYRESQIQYYERTHMGNIVGLSLGMSDVR